MEPTSVFGWPSGYCQNLGYGSCTKQHEINLQSLKSLPVCAITLVIVMLAMDMLTDKTNKTKQNGQLWLAIYDILSKILQRIAV